MGIRRYLTYLKNKVLRLSASPHAVAAGFASGAAVSIFPFIGLHFFLGFVLAFFVRGNMLAAALGTAVGNPLTFPIIFGLTYRLGEFLLGALGPTSWETARAERQSAEIISEGLFSTSLEAILPALRTMSIGAIPLSILTFAICYWLIYKLVSRFQEARRRRTGRPVNPPT
jgi:uncharacterized protein